MLLDVRSTAINIAVVFFFGIGVVGWVSGLSPAVCCKRALLGAVGMYIAAAVAIKIFNAIVMNAAINAETNRRKERANGNK
jgi:hypothetical protein